MGLETALAIGTLGSVAGSIGGYAEARAARKRQTKASDEALAITSQPLPGLDINAGQDSFMQYLRANPASLQPFMFDYSKAFKDLQANDTYNINDQVNALRSGAGSLGQRFGSGFASREAMLRNRFAADIAARNAGIAQNSFNTALQTGLQSYGIQQQNKNNILQYILAQRGQQLQALGLGSQPLPSSTQPIAGGLTDIAQLMLLGSYLGKGGGK